MKKKVEGANGRSHAQYPKGLFKTGDENWKKSIWIISWDLADMHLLSPFPGCSYDFKSWSKFDTSLLLATAIPGEADCKTNESLVFLLKVIV